MNMDKMQSSVSKTLFIPLAARAMETQRSNPVVVDKKAVEIIAQIKKGDVVVEGGDISTHGILARTKVIDGEIKRILAVKPNTVIINLGAGLDTRICRIDNG